MCLIQIVIFLFAASLSMMNDGSQGGCVMNDGTLAPLHALLILLLYYSYNPAGCSCPPYTLFPLGGAGEEGRSRMRRRREEAGGGGRRREGGWSSSCRKAPPLIGQGMCVCVCVCVCETWTVVRRGKISFLISPLRAMGL